MTTPARRVLAALALVLLLAGCGREFGPGETAQGGAGAPPPGTSDVSADAARTKLGLQVQDPCYTGDPRQAWPRCARWVEETASSARSAATALPSDRRVVDGATAVAAGRDAFLGRGCGTAAGAPPVDPGACIGALGQARDGVRALSVALGVPGV